MNSQVVVMSTNLKLVIAAILMILGGLTLSAQSINQVDENGERHGKWVKNFEGTKKIRYEGTFEHGREVGIFKYYTKGQQKKPASTLEYVTGSNEVKAKFYTSNGDLISEGTLIERKRHGLWTTYHKGKKAVMMTEEYTMDKLDGSQKTYYPNGQLAEDSQYKNGKRHGSSLVYDESGVLIKDLNFKDDKFHGLFKYYNLKGELIIEGNYRDDKKVNVWRYYENGQLTKEEKFPG